MRMNKQSIVTVMAFLLCFILLLSLGLYFTAPPSVSKTVKKFEAMGYKHAKTESGKINAHSFNKDGRGILIVWYKSYETAVKAHAAASNLGFNAIMRGNAVAVGCEEGIAIFKSV